MGFKLNKSMTTTGNTENELAIRFSGLTNRDLSRLRKHIQRLNKAEGDVSFSMYAYTERHTKGFVSTVWAVGEDVSNDRFYLMDMIELLKLDVLGDLVKISFHYTSKTSRVFSIDLIRTYGE